MQIAKLIIPSLLNLDNKDLSAVQLILKHGKLITTKNKYFEHQVAKAFIENTSNDIPAAIYTAKAQGLVVENKYYIYAEPVQLKADLAGVYLLGTQHLNLTEPETKAITSSVNELLQQDQMQLCSFNNKHWYIYCDSQPQISTTPPEAIIGKEIGAYLPQGRQQSYWRRLQTEIQMLLHQHPVNSKRQQAGFPEINGLWFWGAGTFIKPQVNYSLVITDHSLTAAFADAAGIQTKTVTEDVKQVKQNILITIEQLRLDQHYGEPHHWQQHAMQIDKTILQPCIDALKQKQIDELILISDDKEIHLTKKMLKRWFW